MYVKRTSLTSSDFYLPSSRDLSVKSDVQLGQLWKQIIFHFYWVKAVTRSTEWTPRRVFIVFVLLFSPICDRNIELRIPLICDRRSKNRILRTTNRWNNFRLHSFRSFAFSAWRRQSSCFSSFSFISLLLLCSEEQSLKFIFSSHYF